MSKRSTKDLRRKKQKSERKKEDKVQEDRFERRMGIELKIEE